MRRHLILQDTDTDSSTERIHRPTREDSPKVAVWTSGVGLYTLEAMLRRGVAVKGVVSDKEDQVTRLARNNKIPAYVARKNFSIDTLLSGRNKADYLLVAFTDHIIPNKEVEKYNGKLIGVHASSLPKYHGAYPIHAALMDGLATTDIVTFLLNKEVDRGPLLNQKGFNLWQRVKKGTSMDELYHDIAMACGYLLADTVFNMDEMLATLQEGEPTYSHKPKKKELCVDWANHTARQICNMAVAGGQVYTTLNGKRVILRDVQLYVPPAISDSEMKIMGVVPTKIDIGEIRPGSCYVPMGKHYIIAKTTDHFIKTYGIEIPGVIGAAGLGDFLSYLRVSPSFGKLQRFGT